MTIISDILNQLFPCYRALCGPDFKKSLDCIRRWLPGLEICSIPSGTEVGDWVVPNEFVVREAWIEDPNGRRHLDFSEHPYHLWIYSRPTECILERSELLKKITVNPDLPHAIPMRQTYYQDDWGFCASVEERDALPDGSYRVFIDTELIQGEMQIGEFLLPGKTKEEIIFDSYLCHPRGANDNLSGVAAAVALFSELARIPDRRYSYRLLLWPETIGPIAWIHTQSEKLKNVVGGFEVSVCGDNAPISFMESFSGNGIVDRAVKHLAKHREETVLMEKYSHFRGGCNSGQFNMPSLRIPYGRVKRAGADNYPEYHSSADDLSVVSEKNLVEVVDFLLAVVSVIEKNQVWVPTFSGTPMMSKHGVYPYKHGVGHGESCSGKTIAQTYFEFLCAVDGKADLVEIADRSGMPVWFFDEVVKDFSSAGLIRVD